MTSKVSRVLEKRYIKKLAEDIANEVATESDDKHYPLNPNVDSFVGIILWDPYSPSVIRVPADESPDMYTKEYKRGPEGRIFGIEHQNTNLVNLSLKEIREDLDILDTQLADDLRQVSFPGRKPKQKEKAKLKQFLQETNFDSEMSFILDAPSGNSYKATIRIPSLTGKDSAVFYRIPLLIELRGGASQQPDPSQQPTQESPQGERLLLDDVIEDHEWELIDKIVEEKGIEFDDAAKIYLNDTGRVQEAIELYG
jgi:hypothetical protein